MRTGVTREKPGKVTEILTIEGKGILIIGSERTLLDWEHTHKKKRI